MTRVLNLRMDIADSSSILLDGAREYFARLVRGKCEGFKRFCYINNRCCLFFEQ